MVTLNLSKEFIENQNEDSVKLSIYAIVNTLTELNEVNSVKILIDGEENKEIPDINVNFGEVFTRKE